MTASVKRWSMAVRAMSMKMTEVAIRM